MTAWVLKTGFVSIGAGDLVGCQLKLTHVLTRKNGCELGAGDARSLMTVDYKKNPPHEDVEGHSVTRSDTLPLLSEEIAVSKEKVETGRVRVATRTRERDAMIDEDLAREHVQIDTVPIGSRIDAMPTVRQEGDTTIIPIVEEVLAVERRLVLKEEVRVRRVREMEHHKETVKLRYQEAVVTRHPGNTDSGSVSTSGNTDAGSVSTSGQADPKRE